MDQTKLTKILRLMKLLTGNMSRTIDSLAVEMSLTLRSIYRHIDTIREVGSVSWTSRTVSPYSEHSMPSIGNLGIEHPEAVYPYGCHRVWNHSRFRSCADYSDDRPRRRCMVV